MNPLGNNSNSLIAVIGTAILFSSLQFSVASVEMSSKYSVKNFSKDQKTLQHAADALSGAIQDTIAACVFFDDIAVTLVGGSGLLGVNPKVDKPPYVSGHLYEL